MNTTAAHQADRQIEPTTEDPLGTLPARWSTEDDLLVWTVSRLEGGRRHGVERDCHVVYALSRGYFVEQTRKFRASAEQCIDMLLQGKRAGTTQRKIALDTIIAIRSDPRTGRLQIRALNGTHQLDPISEEEGEVLRQIAGELALRMPDGGASFAQYSARPEIERRRHTRTSADADRSSLVALENARMEDAPDEYLPPQYDLPNHAEPAIDEPLSQSEMPAALRAPDLIDPSPLHQPAAMPAETSPADTGPLVGLRHDPLPNTTQDSDPNPVFERGLAVDDGRLFDEGPAFADTPVFANHAVPNGFVEPDGSDFDRDPGFDPGMLAPLSHNDQPAEMPHVALDPAPVAEAPAVAVPGDVAVSGGVPVTFEPTPGSTAYVGEASAEHADISIPGADVYDRRLDEPTAMPAQFDRRQQRAMRRHIEGHEAAGEAPDFVEHASVAPPFVDASAEAQFIAPATPVEAQFIEPAAPAEAQFIEPATPVAAQFIEPTTPAIGIMPEQAPQHEAAASDLPAGVVFQPVDQSPAPYADAVEHLPPATDHVLPVQDPASAEVLTAHATSEFDSAHQVADYENYEGAHDDRRLTDDPSFPSVFDRRGAQAAAEERPGWAPFRDEPVDQPEPVFDYAAHDPAGDVAVEHSNELSPEGPPAISAPSADQPVAMGGAVGFNPDFDVNPFR